MLNYLMINLLHLILFSIASIYVTSGCSCNSRTRQESHLQRRQALRDRQRQAVLSGRSVRSVIETEVESETTQCPRMSCVRMAPRLKDRNDVYERLSQCDEVTERMDQQEEFEVVVKGTTKRSGAKCVRIASNDDLSTSSDTQLNSIA
ncbi:unnamed protein product [Caenorhabditis sp. 36 PRJEB53466]|nr:unnamed protein product [Caenorhabditis sp. 36 PRJEB53466]